MVIQTVAVVETARLQRARQGYYRATRRIRQVKNATSGELCLNPRKDHRKRSSLTRSAIRSALNTTPSAPRKPASIGSGASSCSTASVTQEKWGTRKAQRAEPTRGRELVGALPARDAALRGPRSSGGRFLPLKSKLLSISPDRRPTVELRRSAGFALTTSLTNCLLKRNR